MLDTIVKVSRSKEQDIKFSILIPSWNNLEYLKLVIRSIRTNSHYKHEIIVILNEGTDGSLNWIEGQEDIDYIHASRNIGICLGLNICRSLVTARYILYMNDDMYALPGWDLELYRVIEQIGHSDFMLSSTMIEPKGTGACNIHADYGDNPDNFEEDALLADYKSFKKEDWQGSTWPPSLVPIDLWDLVGGMSIEFSPGMFSDPDFAKKLWDVGVRYFRGIAKSRVYHFGSKTTYRIKKNAGRNKFLLKWGITHSTFLKKYLKRGEVFSGPLGEPKVENIIRYYDKLKRAKKSF